MLRSISLLTLAVSTGLSVSAAQWTWTWQPAPGEPVPTAEVCTFKYGKTWAYAIEIDDGPKWVRSFAVPFLAQCHYTDAPPGMSGGVRRPFVGSVSVIVAAVGNNSTVLNWDDLNALLDSGWGVMNHSFDHRFNHWSGEAAKLNDQQALEDAFWSQTVLAAKLPGGRAPTAVAYANGYTDYNRQRALETCGIGIATRVSGSSPRDVLSPNVQWMDFNRSYLDEPVWTNQFNGSRPLADFPGGDQDGPASNSLVIDFTHEIQREAGSPNQERWRTRLQTIESRWGAQGADTLWCASTGEVADYVRAAKAAKVTVVAGKLTVSLPDTLPGSGLTLRLSGIGEQAGVRAPEGGALYRQGAALVLTTPRLGLWGALPPSPRLKCIYDGPAGPINFTNPVAVAGVTLRATGNFPAVVPYRVAVRTAKGEQVFAQRTLGPGWVSGAQLCPIVPTSPPIPGTGIVLSGAAPFQEMTVWAIDPSPTNSSRQR